MMLVVLNIFGRTLFLTISLITGGIIILKIQYGSLMMVLNLNRILYKFSMSILGTTASEKKIEDNIAYAKSTYIKLYKTHGRYIF
jgi:hypothetical protein